MGLDDFFDSVGSDTYKNQIEVWRKTHNISREKLNLFHDFLISLYDLIESTYLGSDVLIEDEDIKGHFNWCWDKTINNFYLENIIFKNRGNSYEYFWNFFLEAFYYQKIKGNDIRIEDYFHKLFNFSFLKTRSELDLINEVYKLLEQNLRK